MNDQQESVLVTVHGTNDGAANEEGEKWWQRGSEFCKSLSDSLAAQGIAVDVRPFRWDGANSDLARDRAGRELASELRKLQNRYSGIHLIAHSHGGNVANIAVDRLGGRLKKTACSIQTVGAPFLRRRITTLEKFSAFAFLAITLLGAPLWVWSVVRNFAEPTGSSIGFAVGFLVAAALILVPIIITARVAWVGVQRVRRGTVNSRARPKIFAIWHPRDEAIWFLTQVEATRFEPVPKGALFRASARLSMVLSVQLVILTAILWCVLIGLGSLNVGLWLPFGSVSAESLVQSGAYLIALLPLTSLLFCLLYVVGLLVFGLVPELLLRRRFSERIENAIRGAALGADGVQMLCDVSTRSHTRETEEYKIGGELAQNMQEQAEAATNALIGKHRWTFLNVDGDFQAALRELVTDALTWRSLIHTTYFSQPEIAEVIASRIVQGSHQAAAENLVGR